MPKSPKAGMRQSKERGRVGGEKGRKCVYSVVTTIRRSEKKLKETKSRKGIKGRKQSAHALIRKKKQSGKRASKRL